LILIDDRFLPESEASVSYMDRGYYFGDGIYEVFRIYSGQLYEKPAHYERLIRTASEVKMRLPVPIDAIDARLTELLERSGVRNGILYVQITRGVAPRSHAFPPAETKPVLLAYCNELERPVGKMQSGISAITLPDIRWLRCDLKTLNLLGSVLAKQEAAESGADDVILHRDGIVTECSASNLMIVKDGEVWTHPADHLILHGITRAVVLRLAEENGIPAHETAFSLEALRQADEVFLTGTTMELFPIVTIDGVSVGGGQPGPVTRKLQAAFEKTIPI